MAITDLVPWARNRNLPNARAGEGSGDPVFALHREMNRMFDSFFRDFNLVAPARDWTGAWPHVEVSDTGSEVKVVAELPGLEQNDVEISLHDNVLTLKGEKKSETNGALYSERWHGQFQRSLQLGQEVDPDKVTAAFKNGVLTIALGKRAETQTQVRRIPISKS